jgi:hypothetical protein
MLNGSDALIGVARRPDGTLLAYVNLDQEYEDALDDNGCVPDALGRHSAFRSGEEPGKS